MLLQIILFLHNLFDGQRLLRLVKTRTGLLASSAVLGVLCSFGYAPYEIWPCTAIALSFMCMVLSAAKSSKMVMALTLTFFTVNSFICLTWLDYVMESFGQIPYFISYALVAAVALLYVALPYGILNAIAYKLSFGRTAVFIMCFMPLAFILSDIYIYYFLTGLPWTYFGYTCVEGPLKNYAPFIGVTGINAVLYVLCGSIALTAMRRFLFLPVAAVLLTLGVFLEGVNFTTAQKSIPVAMVQGNIEQQVTIDQNRIQGIIASYYEQTRPLLEEGRHSLIIWPEAALPVYAPYAEDLINSLNLIFKEKGITLVSGILGFDDRYNRAYNSIITFGENKEINPRNLYNKRELVPFGEVVPFEDLLRPLGKIFTIPNSSFSRGDFDQEALYAQGLKLTPVICYEVLFPDTVASMDTEDTNGILMISNYTWFGLTKLIPQQLNMTRMRAMELNKSVMTCTNSGLTAYIDEHGKVVKAIPAETKDILSIDFVPFKGQSLYSKYPRLSLYIIMLLLLISGITGILHKEDRQPDISSLVRP